LAILTSLSYPLESSDKYTNLMRLFKGRLGRGA
jgi:hypothetical protein